MAISLAALQPQPDVDNLKAFRSPWNKANSMTLLLTISIARTAWETQISIYPPKSVVKVAAF